METSELPDDSRKLNGQGRAPFQILVLPFRQDGKSIMYGVFKRADTGDWQFIAGGGEGTEQPIEAARREAFEEAAIPLNAEMIRLASRSMIPVMDLVGHLLWGPDTLVVPEYSFAVRVDDAEFTLSGEHNEYRWVDYGTCRRMLHWASNRNALDELNALTEPTV